MLLFKIPLLLILLFFTVSHAAIFSSSEKQSIFDILVHDDRFTKLIKHVEANNLTQALKTLKAGTVFAPINDAFEDDNSAVIAKRQISREQLLYHIIPIEARYDELWDGRLLNTDAELDGRTQVLKVLKSFTGIEVGAGSQGSQSKVVDSDIIASNGVIHTLDRVVPLPVYLDETLSANDETRDFYEVVHKARMGNDLKNAASNTIFVSKYDFFGDSLSPAQKSYLLEQPEGRKDLKRFINHQISPNVIYSFEFKEGKSKIKTVEGSENLDIVVENKKGSPSAITVNGVKIVVKDIIAANGVIHVVDSPLLPKDENFIQFNARKALIGMNATEFIDLFDKNGLGSYLDDNNDVPITLLAPSNDALEEAPYMSHRQIKEWLKYHIVHGRYDTSDLHDGQLLQTESENNLGEGNHQRIRVRIIEQDNKFAMIKSQSIQFGKAGASGAPVQIGDKMLIYPISAALSLPRDVLNELPINLELSTFVASLYASDSDEAISKAKGITLFAPTNEAFGRLGLLAKHLLQPESKKKLAQVVTYHAVRNVFYDDTISEGEHRESTLSSGTEILLNKTKDGLYIRGSGAADGTDRTIIGQVIEKDIITANGVIHTVDRVQVPHSLEITNRDLLSVEGTSSLLSLLKRTNLTDKILDGLNKDRQYTILAPSDNAFAKLNLSALLQDHDKLLKIAKLHVLPVALPRLDIDGSNFRDKLYSAFDKKDDKKDHDDVSYGGSDLPSLLEDSYVVLSKNIATNGYSVKVKGSSQESGEVINLGRTSNGGGVIMIDRVLVPEEVIEHHGMAWWKVVLIVIGSMIGLALLAAAIFVGWGWYKNRREGYHSLGHD